MFKFCAWILPQNAPQTIPLRITYLPLVSITHQMAYYVLSTGQPIPLSYTGHFIMFSMITNIYNKETKGPTLMELVAAIGKLKKFFLTTRDFDVCTMGDTAHIDTIFKFLPHTHVNMLTRVCGKNIVSMCAVSPVLQTSNISSCKKKTFSVFLWLWTIPLR